MTTDEMRFRAAPALLDDVRNRLARLESRSYAANARLDALEARAQPQEEVVREHDIAAAIKEDRGACWAMLERLVPGFVWDRDGTLAGCEEWLRGAIGLAPPQSGESDECCCATSGRGLGCTLSLGHDGDHVADGLGRTVLQRWPQEEPAVPHPKLDSEGYRYFASPWHFYRVRSVGADDVRRNKKGPWVSAKSADQAPWPLSRFLGKPKGIREITREQAEAGMEQEEPESKETPPVLSSEDRIERSAAASLGGALDECRAALEAERAAPVAEEKPDLTIPGITPGEEDVSVIVLPREGRPDEAVEQLERALTELHRERAAHARTREEVARLTAWLQRIDGGDSPCDDAGTLRRWAFGALTLRAEAPR